MIHLMIAFGSWQIAFGAPPKMRSQSQTAMQKCTSPQHNLCIGCCYYSGAMDDLSVNFVRVDVPEENLVDGVDVAVVAV